MIASSFYKQDWLEYFQRESKYYNEYETLFPIYEGWERMSTAETIPIDLLSDALKSLYSSAPAPLSNKFLKWVIEVVDRALKDGKLGKGKRGQFPLNRGSALRSRAYATALLSGELPKGDGEQALEDLMNFFDRMERAIADRQHGFDDLEEVRVLTAARLALILGDLDRFNEILPYPASSNGTRLSLIYWSTSPMSHESVSRRPTNLSSDSPPTSRRCARLPRSK